MTKRGRSICGLMFWFHVLYMFISYMFFYMFMFHVLYLIIEHHLRGSFHLPPVFCFITYMFCHYQKVRDCWPKGYNPRVVYFDDNKLYKSYLVLIEIQEWISGWNRYEWLKHGILGSSSNVAQHQLSETPACRLIVCFVKE